MPSNKPDGTHSHRTSGRSASLTRGDKKDGRKELQTYGGPSGRIAKGRFDPALLEKFGRFTWASSIMIEGCRDQETLGNILLAYGQIDSQCLRRWMADDELFHRAFLALANWECNSIPGSRPSLSELTGQFVAAEKKRKIDIQSDKVGNQMIISSRLLSGRPIKETTLKPPPNLSQQKRTSGNPGRTTTRQRSPSTPTSSKTRGKTRKRTQSSRRHGRNDSSAKRNARPNKTDTSRLEEKRSSLDYHTRSSIHRVERRARRRSRSRARSIFRRPSTPERRDRTRPRQTRHSERSTRQRSRSRDRDTSRRNRARTTAERDTTSGNRRTSYYDQPQRRRYPDHRDSHNLRPSSPTISQSSRTTRSVGGMDNQAQTSLILKLLEKTLDRLEPRHTPDRNSSSNEMKASRENATSSPTLLKDNRINFQRWLTAPQSSGSINMKKIFKTIGYNVDVTREDLPPAVSGILALRVLRQAPDLSQMLRCIDWFLRVFEVGLRFDKGNQLLEYIRRAMELRRSSAGSWEDHDVWRAVDDHIMVAKNSKVKLEKLHHRSRAIDIRSESPSSSATSDTSSSEDTSYRK